MIKPVRRLAATCAILLLTAGALAAQKVSFDYDKAADFTGLTTYAFKHGTASGNPLVDGRIVKAITSVLGERGMTNDPSNPDVFVVTHLTFDKKKDFTAYSTSPGYGAYGWYWGGGWGMTDVRVREITTGTLIIDMVDAKKGALIWRGMGVKEVKTQPDPQRLDKKVNEAVEKILRNFPPDKTS
jgi:Domain of unknown function (DUF4136)